MPAKKKNSKKNSSSSSSSNNLLQTETFKYFKRNSFVKVNLFNSFIEFNEINDSNDGNGIIYLLRDLLNCKVNKEPLGNSSSALFTFYFYLPQEDDQMQFSNIKPRRRLVIELECTKSNSFEDNLKYISKWQEKLENLLKQENLDRFKKYNSTNPYLVANNMSSNDYLDNLNRPFLILINPKSGAGKAKNIYHEHIVSVMCEANLDNTIIYTQYANHALEYVRALQLNEYRGIIVVSGDGLIYEVINGLMARPDWEKAIKIPIAQIPAGSGNAFATGTSFLTREAFRNISLENFAKNCAVNIIKSITVPTDLVLCQLGTGKIVTLSEMIEWAIIADVDYESERYRYFGSFRFIIGALIRILNLRVYHGRISFLPVEPFHPKDSKLKILNSEQRNFINKSYSSPSLKDSLIIDQNNNSFSSRFKYLKSFNEPVPSNWTVIQDNFVMLLAVHMPLIGADFLAAPEASFNDGNIHLIFIKEGISRFEMLQLFNQTERAEYLQSPLVEYVKVKAFRLEPLLKPDTSKLEGNIMLDGEHAPYGPIQAEIMSSMGNCLANIK